MLVISLQAVISYDLKEARQPGGLSTEIQEHKHAGLGQEELQTKQRRGKVMEHTAHLFKGNGGWTRESLHRPIRTSSLSGQRPPSHQKSGGQDMKKHIPNAKKALLEVESLALQGAVY